MESTLEKVGLAFKWLSYCMQCMLLEIQVCFWSLKSDIDKEWIKWKPYKWARLKLIDIRFWVKIRH